MEKKWNSEKLKKFKSKIDLSEKKLEIKQEEDKTQGDEDEEKV